MKLEVVQEYNDRERGEKMLPGREFTADKQRAARLMGAGVARPKAAKPAPKPETTDE